MGTRKGRDPMTQRSLQKDTVEGDIVSQAKGLDLDDGKRWHCAKSTEKLLASVGFVQFCRNCMRNQLDRLFSPKAVGALHPYDTADRRKPSHIRHPLHNVRPTLPSQGLYSSVNGEAKCVWDNSLIILFWLCQS